VPAELQPLDFFSPAEITLLCLEYLVELAVLAAVLTTAYTLLDEAMRRQRMATAGDLVRGAVWLVRR
jgi:hypothetical protein